MPSTDTPRPTRQGDNQPVIGPHSGMPLTDYPFPPDELPTSVPIDFDVPPGFLDVADRVWTLAASSLRSGPRHPAGCRSAESDRFWVGRQRLVARHTGSGQPQISAVIERDGGTGNDDPPHSCWSAAPAWFVAAVEEPTPRFVEAARRLVGGRCFSDEGQFLTTAVEANRLSIDSMTLAHAVLRAARLVQDPTLAWRAHAHCLTTRRELVRGDGSLVATAQFDAAKGAFIRTEVGGGSTALAQATALYGFGAVYRITHDRRLLNTAAAVADYYLERTGDDLIPPVEWEKPGGPTDVAAAAAAASGFWQLGGLIEDHVRAEVYADYAIEILERVAEPVRSEPNPSGLEGILGTGRSWSDYCYLDTLDRVGDAARLRVAAAVGI